MIDEMLELFPKFVEHSEAKTFLDKLYDYSVDLFLIDPPYYGIVNSHWDNQWKNQEHFIDWLDYLLARSYEKLTDSGSLIVFGCIGRHGVHPFFEVIKRTEKLGFTFRNLITWKKRRAYGKSHDYLYCREEIAWFTKTSRDKGFTFNIPLLKEKRGYDGFNKKYKAKSEFKRVSNVWDDIPELMRPIRECEKPIPLLERLIRTHSNHNDLVIDFFSGSGSTGEASVINHRLFRGCEAIKADAEIANERVSKAYILDPYKDKMESETYEEIENELSENERVNGPPK